MGMAADTMIHDTLGAGKSGIKTPLEETTPTLATVAHSHPHPASPR
jgi:hypothetical protein